MWKFLLTPLTIPAYYAYKALDQQPSFVDAQKQEELYSKYRETLGFTDGFKYSADAFSNYVKSREESTSQLGSIFQNKEVQNAVNNSKVLQEHLKNILAPMPEKAGARGLATAENEYTEDAKNFDQLVKKIPQLKVGAIIQTMVDLKDSGRRDITQQQAYEKEQLKEKFSSDKALDKLLTENGVQEKDLVAAKQSMLEDLEKTHKAQLDAYDKSTSESIKKLHQAAQAEMDRIIYLATISKHNAAMKKEIAKRAKQSGGLENMEISESVVSNGVGLVEIGQLESIQSRTGKIITIDKPGTKNNSKSVPIFKMHMNSHVMQAAMLNPDYYLFSSNIAYDLQLLAASVKASGGKAIDMNLTYSDEKQGMIRARQAYEACIEAGFQPKDINITLIVNKKAIFTLNNQKVDGKKRSPEEVEKLKQESEEKRGKQLEQLFGQGSERPAELAQRANQIKTNLTHLKVKKGSEDKSAVSSAKEELQKLRKEAGAKAGSTPPLGVPPSSPPPAPGGGGPKP